MILGVCMKYLFIANICVWAGIGMYLCVIHAGQRRIEQRINHLELMNDK